MKTISKIIPVLTTVMFVATACSADTGSISSLSKSYDSAGSSIVEKFDMQESEIYEESDLKSGDINSENSNEYIVKEANISIQVKDVQEKLTEVREIVSNNNGSIIFTSTKIKDKEMNAGNSNYDYESYYYYIPGDYAILNLTVPVENFDKLIKDLNEVGEVIAENTSNQNITSEVLSLESRITSEKDSLDRMTELLNKAETVEEILNIENSIQDRKSNIAALEAELNYNKDKAAESNVTVQLVTDKANKPTIDEMNWFQKTWFNISESSSTAISASIVVIIFLIPISAVVLGFIAIRKKIKGNKKIQLQEKNNNTD